MVLYGTVHELRDDVDGREQSYLIERDITPSTTRSYVYCLSKFLNYLEYCHIKHDTPNLHSSNTCSQKFINHYLNHELSSQLDSVSSLETHASALQAYFNFLVSIGIASTVKLRIFRKTRQSIAERSSKQFYIQYVSRYWRLELLNSCQTLAEKLMIRLGYEVGLRTSELMGLRVSGVNSLTSLFNQLDSPESASINHFKYKLEGRYTKNGRSRYIYLDSVLLEDMKRYFYTERHQASMKAKTRDGSFFLRTDQRFMGTGIGPEQGTRVFSRRSKEAGLNPLQSYHDLRHTFATELFHSELDNNEGRETRSESAALIVVAQRLGHSISRNGQAPAVTTRYIRMRLQMLEIEES
ncbi:tyrosine-type recombinase/integrase [Bacterioplanoides pacificum]|uniref:Tyrosine-type recombinase/integrase n=1 Tax=Bacterioplanoides pacificum TaxID=1171596 RepID=A0ABV7VSD8_9GAMM